MDHDGHFVLFFARPEPHESDCACPADGLTWDDPDPGEDAVPYQSVELFVQPVDAELSVGYSPFAEAARS